MFDMSISFYVTLAIIIGLGVMSIKIIPQQQAWVLETLGRFTRVMGPGLNFIIPFIQRVSYKHSLKEAAIDIHEQTAVTKDNVSLLISGVIYMRVFDPKSASYGAHEPIYAVQQLAQTTMRSEIGKITLDNTFEERERLNLNIVKVINEAASTWGIECLRYEIKDIDPPANVLEAMELQVAAERRKRADVLRSEGERDAKVNVAQGLKQETVLASEAAMQDMINRAQGEAEAIRRIAAATGESVRLVGEALNAPGGRDAASLKVAEQYVEAFEKLAKKSTVTLLPHQGQDVAGTVAQIMGTFSALTHARPTEDDADTGDDVVAKPNAATLTQQLAEKVAKHDKKERSDTERPSRPAPKQPNPWG